MPLALINQTICLKCLFYMELFFFIFTYSQSQWEMLKLRSICFYVQPHVIKHSVNVKPKEISKLYKEKT